MKKKYIVEFTETNGTSYEFEFLTDNIEFSINQYIRNRSIISHRIINEGTSSKKQMLFG
jgi:hypothetical protein